MLISFFGEVGLFADGSGSVDDALDFIKELASDTSYSVEMRGGFVVIRNGVLAKLRLIRSRWKSLAGVDPTKEEAEKFRQELTREMRKDVPEQVARANERKAVLEGKGKGKERSEEERERRRKDAEEFVLPA